MIDINGMAHVILTVTQFDKAKEFYGKLLPAFGMSCVNDGPDFYYHVGARTGIGIRKCDPEFEDATFEQYRVGLHHVCLRARNREDIDKTAELVRELGGKIVRGPCDGAWAPGYYYVLFEDPDGIRLEVNHIPGKGVFATDGKISSSDDYIRVEGKDITEVPG